MQLFAMSSVPSPRSTPAPSGGDSRRAATAPSAWRSLRLAAGAALGLLVWEVQAARVELVAVADSTLFSQLQGGTAYDTISDGGPNVWVSTTAGDVVRRGLLRFDLGRIPQGARITSVELKLTQLRARAGHEVRVHRVTSAWQEAVSTAGDFGQGVNALPGDVTWSHRSRPALPWTQAGGDFVAQPSTSLNVAASTTVTYTWPSTARFVADAQLWLDQPSSNHGIILIGDEANSQSAKRFAAREFDDPEVQPMLVVEYDAPVAAADDGDVPLPAWALGLLGLGLLRTVVRGRR